MLCHHFRREPAPAFFVAPRHGPQSQPKKAAARDLIVQLRKQNHSVYEISQTLKERHCPLSPTAVREVLHAEGFAALPRRLDEERPALAGPSVEPVADVREFSLTPTQVYHRLWRALPVRRRPGAPGDSKAGRGGWLARFQDDPGRNTRFGRVWPSSSGPSNASIM